MVFMFIAAAVAAAGKIKAGQNAKAKGKYDAAVADRDTGVARDQANALALRQQREAAKTMGSMRAAYGAAGVTVEGSPLDVLEESAGQAELDRLTILHNGELKATGLQDNAALSRTAGSAAATAGYVGAVGTMFNAYGGKGAPSWFGGG
jgi:hypothetical protein